MARRRMWEIGCFPIDAVLSTSFDADELISIDGRLALARQVPDHPELRVSPEILVYGIAHRACHSENPISHKIERRLNALHARALKDIADQHPVNALAACYRAASDNSTDLPGCLWALLTDPRPELRRHDQFWVQGVVIRSLRHWRRSGTACTATPESEL